MFTFKLGIFGGLLATYLVLVNTEVGEQCSRPSECGLWHFVCEGGICKCDKEHIPDRENKWCAVDIEAACGYHDECYDPNAECVGVAIPKYGSCQCKKGYTLHKQKRVCSVVIGNNCTTTDDCIEGTCKEKCFCNSPLEPNVNGTKCLPGLHKDCKGFNECAKDNAICNSKNSQCECAKNYKEAKRNGDLLCLAKLDVSCKNTTDCADIGANCTAKNVTEKSISYPAHYYRYGWAKIKEVDKICVCGDGYVRNPKKSECLKVATELNAPCKEDIQCTKYSGIGSECKNQKCTCKSGFYFDEDFFRCVRSCLCDNTTKEINEIKSILKQLKPVINVMAKTNNLDVSRVLSKIQNL